MPLELVLPENAVLVVAAHPDDETLGLGGHLAGFRRLRIITLTDGAPRRFAYAEQGFDSRFDYARARREELLSALETGGIDPRLSECLYAIDQEAVLNLPRLIEHVAAEVRRLRPDIVFTHPYEGGHQDHDAAAFIVHTAIELAVREGCQAPVVAEFTSYHSRAGEMVTGKFLPHSGFREAAVDLSPAQLVVKRRMLDCFKTQRDMLARFALEPERFRLVPQYDFSRLPNGGELWYERMGWGFGRDFLTHTQHAAREVFAACPR